MPFEILDTLSIPGDPLKPNDDAFGHADNAAVVLDGATSLGDPLMPGDSDAAWIAHFGARRLMAHIRDGNAPRDALRHALADAKKSFEALRRHAPKEKWQTPAASMMFIADTPDGFDALWFGDCAALVKRPGEDRSKCSARPSRPRRANPGAPPSLRKTSTASRRPSGVNRPGIPRRAAHASRNRGQHRRPEAGLFSPDARCAEFMSRESAFAAPRGSHRCCLPPMASSRSPPTTAATPRTR